MEVTVMKLKPISSIFAVSVLALFLSAPVTATEHQASGNEGKNDPSVMKREKDGSVNKAEFMKHHEWMFDQNDKNHNGKLEPDEMRNLHKMVKKMHERFDERYGQKN
jgi:hypothetical protein